MANEVFINKGAELKANGEVGADIVWSVESTANNAGRVSAQHNLGALPRSAMYEWWCECQFQATPVAGGTLELYKAGAPDSDNTRIDGDVGLVDGPLGSSTMRRNLDFIGYVVSENAAPNEKCVASGTFYHTEQYISFVAYNTAGSAIHNTDSLFIFKFRPIYDQGQ